MGGVVERGSGTMKMMEITKRMKTRLLFGGVGGYDDDDSSRTSSSWNLEGARLPDTSTATTTGAVSGMLLSSSPSSSSGEEEYVEERTLEQSLQEATDRALDVGVIEGLTPNKRVIKGKQTKDIPWFNDDFGEDFVFEDVVEALTVYKAMYGNLMLESELNEMTKKNFALYQHPKKLQAFYI